MSTPANFASIVHGRAPAGVQADRRGVTQDARELVEVVHTLRQIVNVTGG